jgi:hypothetical protein
MRTGLVGNVCACAVKKIPQNNVANMIRIMRFIPVFLSFRSVTLPFHFTLRYISLQGGGKYATQ